MANTFPEMRVFPSDTPTRYLPVHPISLVRFINFHPPELLDYVLYLFSNSAFILVVKFGDG